MSGIIAIVGRPNVGKSALFNRLAGRRIAIVHDQPGVTRDRISAEVEWKGHPYTLIDTGGIGLVRGEQAKDELTQGALAQVETAIDAAHVILFVVNVQEGLVPLDEEAAARLRRSGKPVLVVINKVDLEDVRSGTVDFARLGFDALFPVSALHDRGITELMDAALSKLPPPVPPSVSEDERTSQVSPLKIAIVGRPNVGKSSLTNALTQSQRVVVSPIPGTTRDAIDVPFEVESDGVRQQYILIDTAGLRKRRRVDDSIEFFSTKRAEDSIRRCDIAILVLDAEAGILEQDKKIADLITEAQKACIVLVNKWDLAKVGLHEGAELKTRKPSGDRHGQDEAPNLARFGQWVQERLFFLDYAPVIFTSAETRFNLNRLLEAIRYVAAQLQQTVPTAVLNRVLYDAIERRQPVSSAGHRLKFFYATQVAKAPPTFLLFVNRKDLFSPEYSKYLGNQIRRSFGYEGCPIVLRARPRPKVEIETNRNKSTRRPQTERHKSKSARPFQSGGHQPARRPHGPRPKRGGGQRNARR